MAKFILIDEDILESPKENFYDLLRKSVAEATRNGIKANSIVINKNMVRVPEQFGMWPEMICGLHCYFTADELPDEYTFSIQYAPQHEPAQVDWIPVTEQLPQEGEPVMAYRADYGGAYGNVVIATYRKGFWYGCMGLEMTHWMPLPEPPKEDV